mmetsp:Transcript_138099/g.240074  ORF Transcript_138099/g.240074 Transcript_138099/m.240074 type:complete len:353 (-) Transcript_138099:834-1892(-)
MKNALHSFTLQIAKLLTTMTCRLVEVRERLQDGIINIGRRHNLGLRLFGLLLLFFLGLLFLLCLFLGFKLLSGLLHQLFLCLLLLLILQLLLLSLLGTSFLDLLLSHVFLLFFSLCLQLRLLLLLFLHLLSLCFSLITFGRKFLCPLGIFSVTLPLKLSVLRISFLLLGLQDGQHLYRILAGKHFIKRFSKQRQLSSFLMLVLHIIFKDPVQRQIHGSHRDVIHHLLGIHLLLDFLCHFLGFLFLTLLLLTFLHLFIINLDLHLHFLLDLNLLAVDLLVHLDRVASRKMVPDVRNEHYGPVLSTRWPLVNNLTELVPCLAWSQINATDFLAMANGCFNHRTVRRWVTTILGR